MLKKYEPAPKPHRGPEPEAEPCIPEVAHPDLQGVHELT
jgi:hypothetical protein